MPTANYAPDVNRAIDDGEFLPHFQPFVAIRTGELRGFELLARWKHPKLGWIPPDEFIPQAERDGWIGRLTRELLLKGFQVAVSTLPSPLMLAVNISPLQLHDQSLASEIEAMARMTGFPLEKLIVEITESALVADMENAVITAERMKSLGCKLALDDFGTGYSSLLHLKSLPFDELKVDRSFVSSMAKQRDSRKIVAAVVGLGQSLGLTTVAEGVETAEQAEMLQWLGCELGQGWLYGPPVATEQLVDVIAELKQKQHSMVSGEMTSRVSVSSLESLPSQKLAQLQAVYDGAPVALAFLDREMRYVHVNRRLANLNGIPMEEHLGRTVEEMVPEIYPMVKNYIRRALHGESITGKELIVPEGGPGGGLSVLLSYEPARDEAGEVIGVSVALMDMTPIRQAEKGRREAEQHFRHMIEVMPQIPWIIDAEGRATDVSIRWLEIAGMKGEEWKGFGWLEALHPDDKQPTIDAIDKAFATVEPIDVIYRIRKSPNDPWKSFRSQGEARVDADGKVICWYGYLEPLD